MREGVLFGSSAEDRRPMTVDVRSATQEDAAAWVRMRDALWPEHDAAWHADEIDKYFAGLLRMPLEVLMAFDDSDRPIGFAELSIRAYAEGCETDRVAFLEGWYVAPEARRHGVGRALVAAAERWAELQGCTEFASDAVLDNIESASAHAALGFEETVQIRCFRKPICSDHLRPVTAAASRFVEAAPTTSRGSATRSSAG